jgi:cytochrome c553
VGAVIGSGAVEIRSIIGEREMLNRLKCAGVFLVLGLAFAATPAMAQNVAHGQSLFNSICVACHGFPPQGGPELAPNNPGLITQAINGLVPAMGFLKPILSAADIVDIAAYIGSLSSPPPPPPGPPPPAIPAIDYTDLWWSIDPITQQGNESGWGVNLSQHPSNVLFVVIYTYDSDRRPMWLVVSNGVWGSPTLYSGPLYRVTGPLLAGPWNTDTVHVTPVGTATLSFTDRDHANFNYSVNGVPVSKTIARTPF